MKRLTCEMCGSTDLIKENGVFVCQSCGCKYSVEEARKMMIEGTVEVTGTVKVDQSANIENYLHMARSAAESKNYEEGENYANKIIEIDPNNSEAWYLKGECAGWQSTTSNNRTSESAAAWKKAMEYAPKENKIQLAEKISSGFQSLFLAMISLHCGNFEKIHDEERANRIINSINSAQKMMTELSLESGVSFDRAFVYQRAANMMNSSVLAAYRDAKNNFGPEHNNMSKYQWERFYSACDNSIEVLKKAAVLAKSTETKKTIFENMSFIAKEAYLSKSYKYNPNSYSRDHYDVDYSFTSKAMATRKHKMDCYDKVNSFEYRKSGERIIKSLNKISDEEKAEGISLYWAEHAEEKKNLEAEIERLKAGNTEFEAEKERLPYLNRINELEKQTAEYNANIEACKKEISSLGLFKGKEKKELQAKIQLLEKDKETVGLELSGLENKKESDVKAIDEKISRANKRINEIQAEFTKSRNSTKKDRFMPMDQAIVQHAFNVSANDVYNHLKNNLDKPYILNELKESTDDKARFGTCWQTSILDSENVDDKGEAHTVAMLFFIADSPDSHLKSIAIQKGRISDNYDIGYENTYNNVEELSRAAGYVLPSLSLDISKRKAENMVCNLLLSDKCSEYADEQITLEYVDCEEIVAFGMGLVRDIILIKANPGVNSKNIGICVIPESVVDDPKPTSSEYLSVARKIPDMMTANKNYTLEEIRKLPGVSDFTDDEMAKSIRFLTAIKNIKEVNSEGKVFYIRIK